MVVDRRPMAARRRGYGGVVKRALLLTYHVPPRAGIASIRIGQLIDGLAQAGWDVVPVTPDFGDTRYDEGVVKTGYVDFKAPVRRLFGIGSNQSTSATLGVARASIHERPSLRSQAVGLGYEWTEYANRQFGWISAGSKAAAALIARERFDAVISSSPPETTHQVAARVHGEIPWIADLRDPWTGDGMSVRRGALGRIDKILEPRTLRSASALTTVSEPLAASLRERYPGIPVYCVPNAFANRDWAGIPFVHPAKATFVYAGQLYAGKRDPRPLFAAISDVLRGGLATPEEMSFDFYGDDSTWILDEIRRHGIGSVVHVLGNRSRHEILALERSASRLLLFLWNDPSERGTYTGKFFEYLGARRRILAIGGPDTTVVDDALAQTGAGERARSVKAIRDSIVAAVAEWRTGTTATVDTQAVDPFESRHLADRFAEVLDNAIAVAR
jgi:hypothetical protein